MKLNKIIIGASLVINILLSVSVHAFSVDKMLLTSDDKGNGVITLTNDEDQALFVQAQIDEIDVSGKGAVKKKPYIRDNISDWKISLTHQRLVLRPGEEKEVGIRSLCHNATCDNSKDLMFMLSFSPSRYDSQTTGGVEMNYGFSPVYIIPTTNPYYSYELFNNGDSLTVENNSNTMINVFVDACDVNKKEQCLQKFTVVAGRTKSFPLSENIQSNELNITVASHDDSYSKKATIKRGKN